MTASGRFGTLSQQIPLSADSLWPGEERRRHRRSATAACCHSCPMASVLGRLGSVARMGGSLLGKVVFTRSAAAFGAGALTAMPMMSGEDFFYYSFITDKDPDAIIDFYSTEDFLQILGIFPFALHFVLAGVVWDLEKENTNTVYQAPRKPSLGLLARSRAARGGAARVRTRLSAHPAARRACPTPSPPPFLRLSRSRTRCVSAAAGLTVPPRLRSPWRSRSRSRRRRMTTGWSASSRSASASRTSSRSPPSCSGIKCSATGVPREHTAPTLALHALLGPHPWPMNGRRPATSCSACSHGVRGAAAPLTHP